MNATTDHPYRLIETSTELEQFVNRIDKEKILAVDLEGDSMFHYQEKVCLVQMAGNGENVVIDPLKATDLSPLAPLFKDSTICKVFHGADYDVRSLYRDFGIEINNLFDTQLASMFLGERETSLEAVVSHRFGIKLDKRYQKKDWSQRPLPDGMIEYAASDVFHLIPLARLLMDALKEKGRLGWVKEECALLSEVRPAENDSEPLFLRFRGAGRMPRRNLAALEGLKIATELADTPQAMETHRCLSAKQIRIYGKPLARIVKKAKSLATKDLPVYPRKQRPSVAPRVPERIKAIKAWRDDLADRLDLDPALLFNKVLMTAIAVKNPSNTRELGTVEGIRNRQVEAFGKDVVNVLSALP
ncbi:MAG: ribonuclease D [Desulfosarcina sp.]|nr:ribonuclease D [Desulfosarcina sp.]